MMLRSSKDTSLYQAIEMGNKNEVDKLLSSDTIPDYHQIQRPSKSLSPLVLAAQNAEPDIFIRLLETYKNQIDPETKGLALEHAAQNGHEAIVTTLLSRCSKEITASHKGEALKCATLSGYETIVTTLLDQCSNEITASHKGEALACATLSGYETIVTTLLDQCSDEITASHKGEALKCATLYGYETIVTTLLDQCSNEITAKNKGTALQYAAKNGHATIITTLLDQCSDEITANNKGSALQGAAQNGHIDALNALLEDESVLAQATQDNNAALRNALMYRNGTDEGTQERSRYDAVIARLMQIPAVAQLANQQANQENNLADIVNFAENSMQSLTKNESVLLNHLKNHYADTFKDKTWDGIRAEILSYLEFEYQKYPAKDGYHRVWMLEDGARKPAHFIPADTIGLHPKGEQCEIFWKSINGTLNQKTVPMSQLHSIYTSLSKESALHQESQDTVLVEAIINALSIPAHPHQGTPLPLEHTLNLNESALTAYYRHTVHNSWRYLNNYNPWMSPQASYVEVLENGLRRAIISDADKDLISYFWLALCDESITLEKGFTFDGNKSVFAATIAELNRGHNCDERALYSEEQNAYANYPQEEHQSTRTDDLQADKPSCSYGVTKRLLQSEYGHPYINCPEARPISLEVLLERMDDLLIKPKEKDATFDGLLDRLKKLDLKILQKIQQEISDILELYDYEDSIILDDDAQKQKKLALETPEEQLRCFIGNTMLWFGKDRIEEHHNTKLKFQHGTTGFRANQYDSYAQFIGACLDNPLEAFIVTINNFLTSEITSRSQPEPIINQFNNNNLKRKRDDDPDNENNNQPDDPQRKKLKF